MDIGMCPNSPLLCLVTIILGCVDFVLLIVYLVIFNFVAAKRKPQFLTIDEDIPRKSEANKQLERPSHSKDIKTHMFINSARHNQQIK